MYVPNSIKVALGIGQLCIGMLLFTGSKALHGGGGQGGGRPGEKGAGEEGVGSGIPKMVGSGPEKGKNYATLRNISQSKKCKGAGAKIYMAGTGIKGYGKREV